MEFPVPRAFPEDEPLTVEGNVAVRLVLGERRVVARRHSGAAIALGDPVAIDLDLEVPARRPDGEDVPRARAELPVVGIRPASIRGRVLRVAVHRLDAVVRKIDS